ncbi:AraC-type DNA-binding protein [Pseudomonas cuatrocienegasensis]|uniref:AraC-type DNA-binding protein n=1 Tax=Pseudomonas cuatrocienegasensis TaxID=543360 RepID=A0ABY1B1C7_9PSED|nr:MULTISPECIES: AraC family transcriptional regulator [Pseudomonas]SEP68369.1 AraC-type DNA-binding protein [Pseudomonas cuatrocienegasensis]
MTQVIPRPPRRSITSVQLLTQLGLDHGLSVDSCLADTGLTPLQLADLQGEIDTRQELQVVSNLITALPAISDLGLRAGLRYQLTTYGIWGYAMLGSQNFRQAAELGLRYLDLTFALNHIHLLEEGDQAHLYLEDRDVPPALRGFLVQRDLMAVLVIQRELIGSALPLRGIQLRQSAPADTTPFIERLGVLPAFDSPCNRMSFDRALLEHPLPRANPHSVQLCEAQCQALLARRQEYAGLAGQVRRLLLARPGRLPDMEQVAEQLHMSTRTLRRKLTEQHSSFRALQDDVRQALAEDLLSAGGLSLEEIAERLGYGEASNFIHAFRRWTGSTPGQYGTKPASDARYPHR